jgi:hypothetical protein
MMTAPDEIDTVARSIVDPKLADAFEELRVSQQARFNTNDPLSNLPRGSDIFKVPQPLPEFVSLPDLDHA